MMLRILVFMWWFLYDETMISKVYIRMTNPNCHWRWQKTFSQSFLVQHWVNFHFYDVDDSDLDDDNGRTDKKNLLPILLGSTLGQLWLLHPGCWVERRRLKNLKFHDDDEHQGDCEDVGGDNEDDDGSDHLNPGTFFSTKSLSCHENILVACIVIVKCMASRQVPPGQLPRRGTCPKWNLSGGKLSGIHIRKCTFLTRHIPQPCARRAHRNPPTNIYSPNVGSLYPIQVYI